MASSEADVDLLCFQNRIKTRVKINSEILSHAKPSVCRCCHSLGGRARWQPSTHRWFGILAIVAWRTTLYKNNGKAHCPSEGTAESQRPSKI